MLRAVTLLQVCAQQVCGSLRSNTPLICIAPRWHRAARCARIDSAPAHSTCSLRLKISLPLPGSEGIGIDLLALSDSLARLVQRLLVGLQLQGLRLVLHLRRAGGDQDASLPCIAAHAEGPVFSRHAVLPGLDNKGAGRVIGELEQGFALAKGDAALSAGEIHRQRRGAIERDPRAIAHYGRSWR